MYATCLFCNGALGRNEAIEHFPVGRRLVFDAARGRLWVVCPRCARWNLTPLDVRWEAIEEAERAYRDCRLRAATDNIGLARLREGTELVRIGRALLPEFAGWRYGRVFDKRRNRTRLTTSIAVLAPLAGVGLQYGGLAATLGLGATTVGLLLSVMNLSSLSASFVAGRRQLCVRDANDRLHRLNRTEAAISELVQTVPGGPWSLRVFHRRRFGKGRLWQGLSAGHLNNMDPNSTDLTGEVARRALATIIPAVNAAGAKPSDIHDAVTLIAGQADAVESLVGRVLGERPRLLTGGVCALAVAAPATRLALEMSLHERDERAALDGELHVLEARWREAEEIASISDDLLLSPDVEERLARLRDGPQRG